jgi:hypothetical protein
MIGKPASHRWRLAFQRLELSPEILPSHEQGLHSRMMAQAQELRIDIAIGE